MTRYPCIHVCKLYRKWKNQVFRQNPCANPTYKVMNVAINILNFPFDEYTEIIWGKSAQVVGFKVSLAHLVVE